MQQTAFRPSSVLVIAIFQFIFGGLGLLCDISQGANQAGGSTKMVGGGGGNAKEKEMQEELERNANLAMERRLPGHKTWAIALLSLDVVLCFMMIASGIGLLQMQPWGRTLAMGGAALSIILRVFNLLLGVMVVLPATREVLLPYAQQVGGRDAATVMRIAESTVTALVWCPGCLVIYPVLVLVVLLQPGVAAAFEARERAADVSSADPTGTEGHFRPGSGPTDPDDRFRS